MYSIKNGNVFQQILFQIKFYLHLMKKKEKKLGNILLLIRDECKEIS